MELETLCVSPADTVLHALQVIDRGVQLALVVDANRRLVGTLTDGDVRRFLLRGGDLQQSVAGVMNPQPHVLLEGEPRAAGLALMRRFDLRHVPRVDRAGKLLGLYTLKDVLGATPRDNWVVLMAGGTGTRLYPLTRDIPKPLVRIGNKPILHLIIENLASFGFGNFFISVNYKADLIEAYFGGGENLGVKISYLREPERLGTAGALSLLPGPPTAPVLAMNGDLLTRMDFASFLDTHTSSGAAATMALTTYEHRCPYGVVTLEEGRITRLEEKPTQQFLVNAGIYALSPAAVAQIAPGAALDMPGLFQLLAGKGQVCSGYPIADYWIDIGRLGDLERARTEFDNL